MVSTYVDGGFIFLEATQDLKSSQFPLAALGRIDGADLEAPVYRGRVAIDELDGALCSGQHDSPCVEVGKRRTAAPYRDPMKTPFYCLWT